MPKTINIGQTLNYLISNFHVKRTTINCAVFMPTVTVTGLRRVRSSRLLRWEMCPETR